MTKRTWLFRFLTTLLILGLAACGGSGGGGGGGGGGIPTATNAAIAPPPTTPVAIVAAGGGTTSQTNQGIGANSLQGSDGAVSSGTSVSGFVGVQAANGDTKALPKKLAALVLREAEKIKDHQPSLTGALQVQTQPCGVSGTSTVAFDDAAGSLTEVFVNCNEGGDVVHGTILISNVGQSQNLGATPGSSYNINVSATFTIDLSIASAGTSVVTQGSFTFTVGLTGFMQAVPNGGVQPGPFTVATISLHGTSLLSQVVDQGVTVRALLSNFNLTIVDSNVGSITTVNAGGGYTFADTTLGGSGGSVTVLITQPIIQGHAAANPASGEITITSSASPGKIVVKVISLPGVEVDVYANAGDATFTDTKNLTWAEVEAL